SQTELSVPALSSPFPLPWGTTPAAFADLAVNRPDLVPVRIVWALSSHGLSGAAAVEAGLVSPAADLYNRTARRPAFRNRKVRSHSSATTYDGSRYRAQALQTHCRNRRIAIIVLGATQMSSKDFMCPKLIHGPTDMFFDTSGIYQ